MNKVFSIKDLIKKGDTRFFTAVPERCYRVIGLPINVNHITDIDQYRQGIFDAREIVLEKDHSNDPKFCLWLDSIGLEIRLVRLFINTPFFEYTRHIDCTFINDQTVALNFPFNDEGSTYSWYNLKSEGVLEEKLNRNGTPVYFFNPTHCKEIVKVEIHHQHNQPILLNTGYIHSVQVGNTNRYCVSYFLKRKDSDTLLQWDEALEIFAPYIW